MNKLSSVKYNRLVKLSQWSKYGRTWKAIINDLEPILVLLTAEKGAKLIDISQKMFSAARNIGYNESKN